MLGTTNAHMLGVSDSYPIYNGLVVTGGVNMMTNLKTTTGWHSLSYTSTGSGASCLAYGNNRYMIMNSKQMTGTALVAVSLLDSSFPSGALTPLTTSISGPSDPLYLFSSTSCAFGAGVFVAAGSQLTSGGTLPRIIYTANNGSTWTPVTLPSWTNSNVVTDVKFDNGYFYATSSGSTTAPVGVFWRSTDGINWTAKTSPDTFSNVTVWLSAAVNGLLFLMPGNSLTTVYISADNGDTFTSHTTSSGILPTAYANGTYVSTVVYGSVYTSTNGYTWTSNTNYLDLDVVTVKDNAFVSTNFGGGTKIYTSTNGISWGQSGAAPIIGQPTGISFGA